MFEKASRLKLRFDSPRGELTVEQLWDLPMSSVRENVPSLDLLGREAMAALKSEESFVEAPKHQDVLQLRLDILKHIRDTRLAELKDREQEYKKAAEKEKLQNILELKKEAQLSELTLDEIQARIDAL